MCGLHRVPSDYPLNYYSIKEVDSARPRDCDVTCYDEDGVLREECYEDGNYTGFLIGWHDYCNMATLIQTLGRGAGLDANDCTSFRPIGLAGHEVINTDKDFEVCSYKINGDDLNSNPVVFKENAESNNGCCGDDSYMDIGFRADTNKFICVDDSGDYPGRYQWMHAGQNEFKIVPINRITERGTASYDVVSNAEQWFVCKPGVEITGPDVSVDVLDPFESLTGYQSLQQGVIAETLGDLGVSTSLTIPSFVTEIPGEVVEFSNFGLDFEAVGAGNVTALDADADGFIDVNQGGTDCDDTVPTIHPGAFDPCGDNVDQDCDGFADFPDGAFCQPVDATLNIPDVASRFICYNENDDGRFAECCGYDLNRCYNQVPKGRRQGSVITTIEEFQEGCFANKNCVQKFGLVPRWRGEYYSFDVPINKTDVPISDWRDYESFEFFIYLADDYAIDAMILGSQYRGDGNSLDDYTLLFHQPAVSYAVNSPSLGRWMHVVIPIDDNNWILEPRDVTHILLYADANQVRNSGGKTRSTIAGQTEDWENVIGVDRFFLRPKEGAKFCSGTNFPQWIDDLDDNTSIEQQELGKAACEQTPSFGWTGSQCCGDDTGIDEKEYFSDSFSGCWNGEILPNDHTVTNVEYELSYNIPTYTSRFQSSVKYPKLEFEIAITGKRITLEEETFAGPYDMEITAQESPKLIADLAEGGPPILTKLVDYDNPSAELRCASYPCDVMCPAGTIGCGLYGQKGKECLFWSHSWPSHSRGLYCCPTQLQVDLAAAIKLPSFWDCSAETFVYDPDFPEKTMYPGSKLEYGLCPLGYAVCGLTLQQAGPKACELGSGYTREFFQTHYCCPVKGALFVTSTIGTMSDSYGYSMTTTTAAVQSGIAAIAFALNPTLGLVYTLGQTLVNIFRARPEDLGRIIFNQVMTGCCNSASSYNQWSNRVYQAILANNPLAPDVLKLKIEPEDPRLRVYFASTGTDITKNLTDKVYAEFAETKPIQGYTVTPSGTKKITKTITASCRADKCIFPLPGEPPYTVKNLHPEEYNITVNELKRIIIAQRVPQRIKFNNRTFYGCMAPSYLSNYGINIDNTAQACEVIGNHFCSPSQGWNNKLEGAPTAASRNTVKSTPEGYPIQSTSCCPSNYCWNSTSCIPSEINSTSLINPLEQGDNIWRCLNGEWVLSIKRYTWDFSQEGFCPEISQCLVDPAGNSSLNNQPQTYNPTIINIPACIETGQFIEDHYCSNGTWTSRTKLIALTLLDLINTTGDPDEYTLFCDNYKNALANYNYFSIEDRLRGRLVALPLVSVYTCADNPNYVMPCVNNFCVLKYTDKNSGEEKVVFGTSLNRAVDDLEFSFLRAVDRPMNYCSGLINTSTDFSKCSNDPSVWYSDAINSVIFSKAESIIGPFSFFDAVKRFIFNPFTSIINYVVDIIAPRAEPSGVLIDYDFTKKVKDFNRVYVNRLYDVSIRAVIEQPQIEQEFVAIKYEGVPQDVCLAVDAYDKAYPPAGQITCTKEEGNVYYVISDQEIALQVWTDFTAKLRPVRTE
jgi:hypothetical protein